MTLLDVTLQIFRYKPGEQPRYDTFTVQVDDTAHVIDAIDKAWAEPGAHARWDTDRCLWPMANLGHHPLNPNIKKEKASKLAGFLFFTNQPCSNHISAFRPTQITEHRYLLSILYSSNRLGRYFLIHYVHFHLYYCSHLCCRRHRHTDCRVSHGPRSQRSGGYQG